MHHDHQGEQATIGEEEMSTVPVCWSDAVDDTIRGDLVAAAAYLTPAGGAVVTSIATCGLDRRAEGILGFTTSLGFGRKLEHIIRERSAGCSGIAC